MVQITSAGTGSGMDMESIISALVSEKSTQLARKVTSRKNNAIIEESGLNSLKSNLKTFKNTLENIDEASEFNARKITTSSGASDVFSVSTNSNASNINFDLTVKQLASAEKITQTFDSSSLNNAFAAGQMTIDLGQDEDGNALGSYTIDVSDGDTLADIRTKLNKNDLGISVNLISSDTGYTMSFTNEKTGAGVTQMSITTTPDASATSTSEPRDALSIFDFSSATTTDGDGNSVQNGLNGWTYTAGKDAIIDVDGQTISSHTNTFNEDQVAGVSITVKAVSPDETTTDASGNSVTSKKSYNVSLATDTDTVISKVNSFVSGFNTLMSNLSSLTARNTYTDGESNEDGGDLAGDAATISIKNMLTKMITNSTQVEGGQTIFDMGLEFNKDGTISLDSTKFAAALKDNYNGVVSMFTDENTGLITQMKSYVNEYTKSSGVIDKRLDTTTATLKSVEQQEERNATILENYETMLRKTYGNLDSLMASYNASSTYLSSVISSLPSYSSSKS